MYKNLEKTQNIFKYLSKKLTWNLARIKFLSNFLESLMKVKTVNLKEVANWMDGTKEDSIYKRIQRFFKNFNFEEKDLINLVLELLNIEWPYFLSMDRTNWKYWKTNINILTIWIVFNGIAFPICWELLDKKWNSNSQERIDIMKKVIKILWDKSQIKWLLADREFVWEDWFKYLIDEKIPFWIRIIDNYKLDNSKLKIKDIFKWVWKKHKHLDQNFKIKWNNVFLSASNFGWELLVVASNIKSDNAINNYLKRWSIEVLFSCLKTTWFNFESTHLTDHKRISKLFWILWFAFTWCYKVGEKLEQIKPIKIKKHWRKSISTFKLWFRFISRFFYNFLPKKSDLKLVFYFLSCT